MTRPTLMAKAFDKKGNLLAKATNSYTKTHPLMLHFGKQVGCTTRVFLHAEIAALLKCKDKEVYELQIERRKRNGEPGMAKPCPICEKALLAFGVRKVSYTLG